MTKWVADTVTRQEYPQYALELLPHPDHLAKIRAVSVDPGVKDAATVWWYDADADSSFTVHMVAITRCGLTTDQLDKVRLLISMTPDVLADPIDAEMTVQGKTERVRFERALTVGIKDPQTQAIGYLGRVPAVPTGWVAVSGFVGCEGSIRDDTLSVSLTLEPPYLVDAAIAGPRPLVVYIEAWSDKEDLWNRDTEPVAEMRIGMRGVK